MLLSPHQEQIKLPPCKWAHTTATFQSLCMNHSLALSLGCFHSKHVLLMVLAPLSRSFERAKRPG